jgi:hypothetical protein
MVLSTDESLIYPIAYQLFIFQGGFAPFEGKIGAIVNPGPPRGGDGPKDALIDKLYPIKNLSAMFTKVFRI